MKTFTSLHRYSVHLIFAILLLAAGILLVSFGEGQGSKAGLANADKRQTKKAAIKIYPNPSPNGIIYISCEGNRETLLHFYVFDLEGTMMHNLKIKGRDRKMISGLKKGIYLYDVFENDESVERGKIIVK